MASNRVVRTDQPDSHREFLVTSVLLIISALFELFEDKEAKEEQRKQMELSMKQGFSQAVGFVAGSLATGLNVLLLHAILFLQAAGIPVDLPVELVTPEGVIFVTQCTLLLLTIYGVIYLVFLLATFFLKRLWWLLKVAVALACLGLILSDHSVGTETMAFRLVCLLCVCLLLSNRLWNDQSMAARIVHLEEQVRSLEDRLKEAQRWRRKFITLSSCLIGLLCFVVFILIRVWVVISDSEAFEYPYRGFRTSRVSG